MVYGVDKQEIHCNFLTKMGKGYIKASILFQGGEDEMFDMDYYLENHVPLMKKVLGDSVKYITVERGVSGGAPGSIAPYVTIAGIYFENMEALNESFALYAGEIMKDFINFTNGKPLILISEVVYSA